MHPVVPDEEVRHGGKDVVAAWDEVRGITAAREPCIRPWVDVRAVRVHRLLVRTACRQRAHPRLAGGRVVAGRRAGRGARMRLGVPRHARGSVLDRVLAVGVRRRQVVQRVEPAPDDPRVGARVVPRVLRSRVEQRVRLERLPLRRVLRGRLRPAHVVERKLSVVGQRRDERAGRSRGRAGPGPEYGARRDSAGRLVVHRLRARALV